MKKHLLVGSLLLAAAIGSAEAQEFRARAGDERPQPRQRAAAPSRVRPAAGGIPRGIRGGNPLQMLNPRAPQRYRGSIEDTVTYDQDNPSKITGIILFGIRW